MSDIKAAEKIESWPIERLIPYEKNAKIHDPAGVMKIAEAIRAYGFRVPIRVAKNDMIIAGHGRRLAAMQLGMKYVPVIVDSHLKSEADVRAARLSDNKVAEGENDNDLLQEELEALAGEDIDLGAIGFDERELDFLTDEDLDALNEDVLVEDIDTAVAEQSSRVENSIEQASEDLVPISKAFGFSKVSMESARHIGLFMSMLEETTGKLGADALNTFVVQMVDSQDDGK